MLVTVKAGAKVEGHTFSQDSNQNFGREKAEGLIKDGRARPAAFDAEGICRINTRFEAWLNEHGALAIGSCGDAFLHLSPEFPLAYLPEALQAYQAGHHHGMSYGRSKLQNELLNLLGAEPCKI
ncbi:hypothetical protein [Bradyrhizobium embrapense]|uniref:hypothetical protein n=1 Tax=Bradyrhizobium embrapense TaxID=630921 RepID=UPI00067D8B77|nr:hypothetical protein [Bradyrhizobium embrapense]